MRIAFVVVTLDGIGGTARAVVNLANQLVARHDVRIISLQRWVDTTHAALDPRVVVDYLIDGRDPERLEVAGLDHLPPQEATRLSREPSMMIPTEWEWQFSSLTDRALTHALPRLRDDVLVTVIPGLLAMAAQLLPPGVALVHQEHRNSFGRSGGKDALLAFAPRADVVAMLGEPAVTWLHEQLGRTCPETLVVPNMVPPGYRPRSRLAGNHRGGLIVAAGRLSPEKQFTHLVRAFGEVADELPGWRLRIFGTGPQRPELVATALEFGLGDRVELPGTTRDMQSEWARADVVVSCSVAEGMPLVLQEAMAAGVPVVSYDCPLAVRDMVDDGVDGLLVAPDAVHGLAAALLRLGRDGELRAMMGAAALRSAQRYEAAMITRTWESIFERAIAGRRARPVPSARPPAPKPAEGVASRVASSTARRELLEIALAAARGAGADPQVLPHPFPEPVSVVVPMTRRRAVLDALVHGGLPSWACVTSPPDNGWTPLRGTAPEVVAAIRHGVTPRVTLEPWSHPDDSVGEAAAGSVTIEFWTLDRDDVPRAPWPNPWLQRIDVTAPRTSLTVDGVEAPTLTRVAEHPAPTERRFPVDAVYLPSTDAEGGDSLARELDLELLRYSLRSLRQFLPWLRTVHAVLPGPRPTWLRDDPGIVWTDARGATTGAAADSAAWLESAPDVADHVVVLREEVLLGRPVGAARFFDAGGRPRVAAGVAPPGTSHRRLGALLLQHVRGPQPLRRSLLAEAADRLPELTAGEGTLSLDVRSVDVARGDVGRTLRRTLAARDTDTVALFRRQPLSRPGFARRHLTTFLTDWTPVPAPWESDC